jgi:hypothetical protein
MHHIGHRAHREHIGLEMTRRVMIQEAQGFKPYNPKREKKSPPEVSGRDLIS